MLKNCWSFRILRDNIWQQISKTGGHRKNYTAQTAPAVFPRSYLILNTYTLPSSSSDYTQNPSLLQQLQQHLSRLTRLL